MERKQAGLQKGQGKEYQCPPIVYQDANSLPVVLATTGQNGRLQPPERGHAHLGRLFEPAMGRRAGVATFGRLLRETIRVPTLQLPSTALLSMFVISERSYGGLSLPAALYDRRLGRQIASAGKGGILPRCKRLADTELLVCAPCEAGITVHSTAPRWRSERQRRLLPPLGLGLRLRLKPGGDGSLMHGA